MTQITKGRTHLERAGDNLGAVAGPLLAAGLLAWVGVRPTLYLAAIPGIVAAVTIVLAARESRRRVKAPTDLVLGGLSCVHCVTPGCFGRWLRCCFSNSATLRPRC
jgi:MFS family permease